MTFFGRASSIGLVALLLLTLATPLATPAAEATSGRAGPDFSVTALTLDNHGSVLVDDAGLISVVAAPGDHTVRIEVANVGTLAGSATLELVHKGSPTAFEVVVDQMSTGSLAPGAAPSVFLMTWTAATGQDQTLFARVQSLQDGNTMNDERELGLDVERYLEANTIDTSHPTPSPGQSTARLSLGTHDLTATVRNDGVLPVSAEMDVVLTPLGGGASQTLTSNTIAVLAAGSLHQPSASDVLLVSVDATGLSGGWNVTMTVEFTGPSWTDVTQVAAFDVVFSDYAAVLDAPDDRTLQPGTSKVLTFELDNNGQQLDSWNIATHTLLGWTDTSSFPVNSGPVAPGNALEFVATVDVPITASRGDTEVLTVTFTSQGSSPQYTLQAVVLITAGELYLAEVDLDNTSVSVVPGSPTDISLNITNQGNVDTNFQLTAGFSPAPLGWDAEISVPQTGYIAPGETSRIKVTVTPAHISSPLNPAELNKEGDVLDIWIGASAVNGIPVTDQLELTVAPVIVVDPGLQTDLLELSEADVRASRYGIGYDAVVPMDLEVRHNLVQDVNELVNATVEVSDVRFTSYGGAGGFSETSRWSFTPSPENATNMTLGTTNPAVLSVQGPADALPLAGLLEADVTVTPTLSTTHTLGGVSAEAVTRTVSVSVPGVNDGEIIEGGVRTADVGVASTFPIGVRNAGNDVSNYTITLLNTLPVTWSASLGTSGGLMTTVSSLPSPVAVYPDVTSTAHETTFDLTVTSDPLTQAGSITYVDLEISNSDTGDVLGQASIPITVEAFVDAELDPNYRLVNLSIFESPLTSLTMTNTGNTPAQFSVSIVDPDDEVDFTLTSSPSVLIGAGFSDGVKIQLTPTAEAAADVNYSATVVVTVTDGPVLEAVIQANVSEMDDVALVFDTSLDDDAGTTGVQHNAIPGTTVNLPFTLTNSGNYLEDLTLETEIDDGWGANLDVYSAQLAIDASQVGTLSVIVPALGGAASLDRGDVHQVTIYANDTATGALRTIGTVDVVIAPLFDISSPNWPADLLFHRGLSQDISASVRNIGNADIEVNVDVALFRPGTDQVSDDWVLVSPATQVVTLRRGVDTTLDVTVELVELEPLLSLQGELRVTLTPVDTSVSGSAVLETNLAVSRMFQNEPDVFMPGLNDGVENRPFMWTHIPASASTAAVYELELCSAQRLVQPAILAPGIDASSLLWDFQLVTGSGAAQTHDLDLAASGCAGDDLITLPLRQAWDTSGAPTMAIDAPDRPNLLPGDGWDLTFRLYHPNENNGYTEYTEATYRYQLDTKADPAFDLEDVAEEWSITGDRLMEGVSTNLSLDLVNYGTSMAVMVQPVLTCEGAEVLSSPDLIPLISPGETVNVQWEIQPISMDWWLSSSQLRCTADWTSEVSDTFGDELDNNVLIIEEEVVAWSPRPIVVLAGAAAGLLLAALFVALRNQNDNFRLAAVYAGLLGLGFSFHLLSIVWWGPVVLAVAALWTWRMSWRASEEFRVLHEDYQRQRKGLSTMYADHFEALSDTQRALTTILSLPIFGFMLIVMGVPAQVPDNNLNGATLLAYLIVVSFGVIYLLRRSNKTYGRIYGRLTDIETASARIERDLADPARLLGDLAEDGLGLADLLDEASQAARELSETVDWDEQEVADDA
ncbi:MAG TPA: hypothetical protein HA276_06365 [Candidatus Poseidoniaceae archaeon]|nr:MAG TPA: hypothetical protein D7I09_00735 [Candidatus Poseidoniales archaeon]DAC16137.1 MAG TPA: hypothetical protein D7I01_06235 [Candidatus Poseidoniales archaeon]HII17858.1 hypothetical protein [Candidatus Poseidoniaceae archaeon]HII97298.1 hypothetical protein [Candidatus Poseidoniaceae archaeon]